MANRLTYAEGVSAENLKSDLSTQFLGSVVGRVDSAHITLTEKGRAKASIVGQFVGITFDKVKTPVMDNGILFNPSLLEKLRVFFEAHDVPAYIDEKGAVSATAPATATATTDTVVSKEQLLAEKQQLQAKFFQLSDVEQTAAKQRIDAIETALKTA